MARYKTEMREKTLGVAIDDAFGDVQMLAEEMGEWRDNMEEKLSHTDKFERVSECADMLEQHQDTPDVPDSIADIKLSVPETVRTSKKRAGMVSRAVRCSNAVMAIDAAMEALSAITDDDEQSALHDDAQTLYEELEAHKDELDGVEFPGMFG